MITYTDETIKKWYEHVTNLLLDNKTSKRPALYARNNNLDYKNVRNWIYRFNPWYGKYIKQKEREIYLYDLYVATDAHRDKFCAKHGISQHRLTIVGTHRNYIERLNYIYNDDIPHADLVLGKKVEDNSIIEIPKEVATSFKLFQPKQEIQPINIPEPVITNIRHENEPHEVFEPKNEIELSMQKGVKVILSPETTTDKIVKIIEFLKEL